MAAEADPDAILEDIQRVAEKLGKPPSTDEYREHGSVTVPTVYNHFDGFVAAREAAGVSEGELTPNTRGELIEDIRSVAKIVDGEPTWGDYDEYGEYAIKGITYRFDTWNEAKKEAGVYKIENHTVTEEMLIEDMQRVDSIVSGALSQKKYNERGEYYAKTAQRVFGGWEDACQTAGVERPNMGPKEASDERILIDLEAVARNLGHTPSKTEYDELGQFTYGIIQTRFGTMSETVELAGLEPRPEGGQHGELHPLWEGGGERYYGPNWESKKETIRDRDGECKLCGVARRQHEEKHGESLSVHHIIRFKEFDHYSAANRESNLIALCRSCHSQIDEHDSQTREKLRRLV